MCGIAFECVCNANGIVDELKLMQKVEVNSKSIPFIESVSEFLSRRGPDHLESVQKVAEGCKITLVSSVLHLRGMNSVSVDQMDVSASLTPQPITGSSGDLLQWNGEVFHCLLSEFNDQFYDISINDGLAVFKMLQGVDESNIYKVFHSLRGPFAFIYYVERSASVYFARDAIGRRSLVYTVESTESNEILRISSVVPPAFQYLSWNELPSSGIFKLELRSGIATVSHIPWIIPEISQISISSHAKAAEMFLNVLAQSVSTRVNQVAIPSDAFSTRIAVLFSGGIDSLLLAALTAKCLSSVEYIDLINVAFGNDVENVPDRQTGINGYLELEELVKSEGLSVKFRFVHVDVLLEDVETSRSLIEQLIHPSNTVMDFNIGTVLWFASKAHGKVLRQGKYTTYQSELCRYSALSDGFAKSNGSEDLQFEPYQSKARVLLSGLGADELLGGYGRHRTVFRKAGSEGLALELEKDQKRLWRRNLGRDDRLISDHGRELRHPFLDESFVQFVKSLSLEFICDLSLPPGIGDKKILRDAANLLGLKQSWSLQKRAIQFGTRIANKKVAGYVPLTDQLDTKEIVHSALSGQFAPGESKSTRKYLSKKENKRKDKPNFD